MPLEARQNFTLASFAKALLLLQSNVTESALKQCLSSIDMGLLLGAPLEESPELLTETARYLRTLLNQFECTSVSESPKRKWDKNEFLTEFNKLTGVMIDELEVPSIETFNNKYFMPQVPVKLKGRAF